MKNFSSCEKTEEGANDMAQEELKNRADVQEELTWDISALYETKEDFETAIEELKVAVDQFIKDYEGKLTNTATIVKALKKYELIQETATYINHYAFLPSTTDLSNPEYVQLSRSAGNLFAEIGAKLAFFDSELKLTSTETLNEVVEESPQLASFIRHIKADKNIQLDPAVEKALAQLSPTLNAPSEIYEQARLTDMDFGTFNVEGKEYPLSFVLYEDYYMYHDDTAIRRAAFDKFSQVLSHYQILLLQLITQKFKKKKHWLQCAVLILLLITYCTNKK